MIKVKVSHSEYLCTILTQSERKLQVGHGDRLIQKENANQTEYKV